MILQCLAIGGAMLYGAGAGWVSTPILGFALVRWVVYASAAITIVSGVEYAARAYRLLGSGSERA